MAEPFAQPLTKLGDAGIGVAAAPTGGMGLALDANGKLPLGTVFVDDSATPSPRRLAFGSGILNWSGVTAKSDVLTVPHTLNSVPTVVMAFQAGGTSPTFFVLFVWGNGTTTTFDLAGAPPSGIPGAGSSTVFSWIAIG